MKNIIIMWGMMMFLMTGVISLEVGTDGTISLDLNVEPPTFNNATASVNDTTFCGGILCSLLLRTDGGNSPIDTIDWDEKSIINMNIINFGQDGILSTNSQTKTINQLIETQGNYNVDGSWALRGPIFAQDEFTWQSGSTFTIDSGTTTDINANLLLGATTDIIIGGAFGSFYRNSAIVDVLGFAFETSFGLNEALFLNDAGVIFNGDMLTSHNFNVSTDTKTALFVDAGAETFDVGVITLRADNIKTCYGTLDEGCIYYDGTNLVIDPKEVGSGLVEVLGDLATSDGLIRANVGTSRTALRISRAGVTFLQLVPYNSGGGMGLHWGARDEDYASGSNTILTTDDNAEKNHHQGASPDPTFFYYSSTDVDSNPNQWMSLSHNKTDGIISLGTGKLNITSSLSAEDLFIGNETGNLTIDAQGRFELKGSAKIHQHLSIQNANLGKGNTAPTQIIAGNYNGWEYTINDDSVLDIEFPHDFDTTEDASIHLSWFVDEAFASNSGEVQWAVNFSLTPHDETESILSPTHKGYILSGDQNIPTIANGLAHTTNLLIKAGNFSNTEHDILGISIIRVAIEGGNNPTADPTIVGVHWEYISSNLGTY